MLVVKHVFKKQNYHFHELFLSPMPILFFTIKQNSFNRNNKPSLLGYILLQ